MILTIPPDIKKKLEDKYPKDEIENILSIGGKYVLTNEVYNEIIRLIYINFPKALQSLIIEKDSNISMENKKQITE